MFYSDLNILVILSKNGNSAVSYVIDQHNMEQLDWV